MNIGQIVREETRRALRDSGLTSEEPTAAAVARLIAEVVAQGSPTEQIRLRALLLRIADQIRTAERKPEPPPEPPAAVASKPAQEHTHAPPDPTAEELAELDALNISEEVTT